MVSGTASFVETPLEADVSYRSSEQFGNDVDFGLRLQVYTSAPW